MSGPERVVERWQPAPEPSGLTSETRRRRLGSILIALGVAGILWGVFHLLGAVGGPEQPGFAHRQTYNEVKPLVHGAMLGAFLRSFGGLALAIVGARIRANAQSRARASSAGGEQQPDGSGS